MASSNTSTRQRMINVMYLVLLAILALTVSPEVLTSFQRLRDELRLHGTEAELQGQNLVQSLTAEIVREIEREGNLQHAGLLDTIEQLTNETSSILRYLDSLEKELEQIADFDSEQLQYRRADESEENLRFWMGYPEEENDGRGNGAALVLRNALNKYFSLVHASSRAEGQPAVIQDPRPNRDQPAPRWERYTFEGPVLANLATLEAIKLEVQRRQQAALQRMAQRIGAREIVVDTMLPIVVPRSEIVVAGMPYEAEVYTGMSAKTLRPEYFSSMGRVESLPGGMGAKITMQANPGVIPAGQTSGRQAYRVRVKVPLAQGGYDSLMVEEQFTVIKPAIQVSSSAVQQLYAQCANDLQVAVPALLQMYDPVFKASGAEVVLNTQARDKIRVVPGRNRSVVLSVSNRVGGQTYPVGDLQYGVLLPPKPSVSLLVQGQVANGLTPVSSSSRVEIRLQPDEDFRRLSPQDARYRIQTIRVLLKDRLGAPEVVASYSVAQQDPTGRIVVTLPQQVRQAPSGSRVFIQVEGVSRVNFRGEVIPESRLSPSELIFGLDLR